MRVHLFHEGGPYRVEVTHDGRSQILTASVQAAPGDWQPVATSDDLTALTTLLSARHVIEEVTL